MVRRTSPLLISHKNYKKAAVSVSSEVSDAKKEVNNLENLILARLKGREIFDDVYLGWMPSASNADLGINIKIVEMKRVSRVKRFVLGILAGRSSVTVDINLIDLITQETIGNFRTKGQSAAGSSIDSGTTLESISPIADKLVEFIQGKV